MVGFVKSSVYLEGDVICRMLLSCIGYVYCH